VGFPRRRGERRSRRLRSEGEDFPPFYYLEKLIFTFYGNSLLI
jgi:hypothetical protein